MLPRRVAAVSACVLFTAFSIPRGGVRAAEESEIVVRDDVTYVERDGEPLQLDLAYPRPGEAPRPVVVCYHGGGWRGGQRRVYREAIRALARQGYVAATVSYRFSQVKPWPAQLDDVRESLRWIRAHAVELGADTRRVAVLGDSAGGHLSLCLGARSDVEKDPVTSVQAVVNYYGPSDLRGAAKWIPMCQDLIASLAGGTYEEKPKVHWDASPIVHASRGDAPVLTFQGTADEIVPVGQATMYHRELDRLGVPNRLVLLDGLGHGWGGEDRARTEAEARRFLDLHLRGGVDWPLLLAEDFESGLGGWEMTDASTWELRGEPGARFLAQTEKTNSYRPAVRSPYHIALSKDLVVGSFVLDVRMRSTIPDYGHRDLCLFFGHQSPSKFYYVHLAKQGDDHANSIFLVDEAPRVSIARERTMGVDWDDAWHRVRVVRRAPEGTIEVFFDDMTRPVMSTVDKTFLTGRIGVGTFDDTGDFTEIRLRGLRAEP